jgi:hypothetical protein
MRKRLVALGLAAAACGGSRLPRSPAPGGPAVVEIGGMVKGAPFRLGRGDLAALPRRALRAVDPVTDREIEFEGVALSMVVADRLDLKKGADTLVVRTADREAVPVPLWIVRQFRPVLADKAEGKPLDALVLAWPNVDQRGLDTDPRAFTWWTRGVVALDFADWDRSYGKALRPPAGASDAVRLGAEQYGMRCVGCHALRAEGGTRGPELLRASQGLDDGAFAQKVAAHRLWPQHHPELAPGPEAIAQIRMFLRAVGAAGGAADEPAASP